MDNDSKDNPSQANSAEDKDTSKTEKPTQSKVPPNKGRTFSSTGVEKRG